MPNNRFIWELTFGVVLGRFVSGGWSGRKGIVCWKNMQSLN